MRWYDMTDEQRSERNERMAPVLDRIPEIWGKYLPEPGWDDLLLELDAELAALDPDYEIHQAKQKFGELRFYMTGSGGRDKGRDAERDDIIDRYEKRSRETCEECGAPGTGRRSKGGWLYVACEEHARQ